MIRATVLRALVLMAAFAAGLTPVTCLGENLGENSDRLPPKATKELPPELLALLRQKKMPKYSPIVMRVFKEEAELEVWKQDTTGRFQILKIYPICRWSGDLGPKLQEGDRQAPWRLLVERLLCHDRRTDQRDLFAGARLVAWPAVVSGSGLSVPPDAGESGAASK
jgi:hypothetical protein